MLVLQRSSWVKCDQPILLAFPEAAATSQSVVKLVFSFQRCIRLDSNVNLPKNNYILSLQNKYLKRHNIIRLDKENNASFTSCPFLSHTSMLNSVSVCPAPGFNTKNTEADNYPR